MDQKEQKLLTEGMAQAMEAGTAAVPGLLLKHYREMGLSDVEVMLFIHLLYFCEWEKREFPTLEEIGARMSAPTEKVVEALQRLIKHGYVEIEDSVDEATGVHFERYRCRPMWSRLAEHVAGRKAEREEGGDGLQTSRRAEAALEAHGMPDRPGPSPQFAAANRRNIFAAFEAEFARPLSPMEYETITDWLDGSRYPEELIFLALKEAVFAGKVHFKYIDRILLDWEKNRIRTVEQAKEYAQRFRGR